MTITRAGIQPFSPCCSTTLLFTTDHKIDNHTSCTEYAIDVPSMLHIPFWKNIPSIPISNGLCTTLKASDILLKWEMVQQLFRLFKLTTKLRLESENLKAIKSGLSWVFFSERKVKYLSFVAKRGSLFYFFNISSSLTQRICWQIFWCLQKTWCHADNCRKPNQ